jgi:hypothetical protein
MTRSDWGPRSIRSVWTERPGAAAVVAAVGGLIAAVAVACGVQQRLLSGDEPPIRVKNGSIELQLLHRSGEWDIVSVSDKKNWKVKGEPQRGKELYEVIVAPSNASSCTNGVVVGTGDTVQLTTTDGTVSNSIQIKLTGKKTKIKSNAVDLEATGDLLRDSTANAFITKIEVGSLVCNFGSKDTGLRVVIMDP